MEHKPDAYEEADHDIEIPCVARCSKCKAKVSAMLCATWLTGGSLACGAYYPDGWVVNVEDKYRRKFLCPKCQGK